MRQSTACVLGWLKDPRAVEPLIVALSDADANVRKFAAMSLKALTGMDFGKDGEKWRAWWEENKARSRPAGRDEVPNDETPNDERNPNNE